MKTTEYPVVRIRPFFASLKGFLRTLQQWRLISLLALLAFFLPTRIQAQEKDSLKEEGDFSFVVINGHTEYGYASIEQYKGIAKAVKVPEKIGGFTVKSIGPDAWKNAATVRSISLPASLESLSWGTEFCTNLQEFFVDNSNPNYSVKDGILFDKPGKRIHRYPTARVGEYVVTSGTHVTTGAFSGANRLTKITLQKDTSLGDAMSGRSVFNRCPNLVSITVEDDHAQLRSIDGVLFDKEGKILIQYPGGKKGKYTIPDGTDIAYSTNGPSPFQGCAGLTEINLPERTKYIRAGIFIDCVGLRKVVIPSKVELIMGRAFRGCINLETVVFMGNAPPVGPETFKSDGKLTFMRTKDSKGFDDNWIKNAGGHPVLIIDSSKIPKDE